MFVNGENTNKLTSSVPRGTNKNLTLRDLVVIPFVSFLPTFGQNSKNSSSECGDKIKERKMRMEGRGVKLSEDRRIEVKF